MTSETNPKIGRRRQGFHDFILGLKRQQKKTVLMIFDAIAVPISLWFAYFLRIGVPRQDVIESLVGVFVLTPMLAVLIFWYLGLYSTLIRSMENRTIVIIATGSVITGLFVAAAAYMDKGIWVPRSVPAIFAILTFLSVGGIRVLAITYYRYAIGFSLIREPLLIYGAGGVGIQLATALENSQLYSVIGFIDDDPSMQGSTIRGRRIYTPDSLGAIFQRHNNVRVLIAIAKISPEQKRSLIQRLAQYPARIETVPALTEIVSGSLSVSELEKVKIEDLLGRDPIPPIPELFRKAIEGRCIFVSGAGGSIGSEICNQVLQNNPEKLVLFEQNELALYTLEKSLRENNPEDYSSVEVIALLGDVTNRLAVAKALSNHKPDIIYHAAAYKHVPIVESNVFEGIDNNVFGTKTLAEAAVAYGVERFILVSTDKAVRPANVMGASKRVAEEVIQVLASKQNGTVFSMVRFGNVLGSSGSVIPLFESQIAKRQPVTITHPEVTRFFMTIPEASQLVIQAGFLAKGGEVYVLDMGESIKIIELAKLMIQLSGLRIKDGDNQMGDIPIEITGLRPGEKLFEELLIDSDIVGTVHPKIMSAMENMPSEKKLQSELTKLKKAVESGDNEACKKILQNLAEGYPG